MAGISWYPSKPNTAAPSGWAAEIVAIRENLNILACAAASNGGRLFGWSTGSPTRDAGNDYRITKIILTNQLETGIKIKIDYAYNGNGTLNTEIVSFDKGLGAGYETAIDGTFTHAYDGSGRWDGGDST